MYSNQYMIENLTRQKDRIDDMIKNYQQPQPVNNFINALQTPTKDLIEWRILNENEEVDNLYVNNKTLFINENKMVLKGIDGSLEKWEMMAQDCEDEEMQQKYMQVSNTLFDMFMKEHNQIGQMFKAE